MKKQFFIAIDGGTSTTRLTLLENGTVKHRIRKPIGAGNTAVTGSVSPLCTAVREGLSALLSEAGITYDALAGIGASGMITSELGLYPLAHIPAPAGREALARGAVSVSLPDICPLPITFIPGVKTIPDMRGIPADEVLFSSDMMRGEETEVFGLLDGLGLHGPLTVLLPGTHNKIIMIDEEDRIVSFVTTMSGELNALCREHSILRAAFAEKTLPKTVDENALLLGYRTAEELGMTAALFKTRILANAYGCEIGVLSSFLAGVLYQPDVRLLKEKYPSGTVLIGGGEPMRSALACLVREICGTEPVLPADALAADAAALGIYGILSEKQGDAAKTDEISAK